MLVGNGAFKNQLTFNFNWEHKNYNKDKIFYLFQFKIRKNCVSQVLANILTVPNDSEK